MNPQPYSVDFRSGIPVYVQIVEQVQAHLAHGNLVPGDQLPTVRQMASELRVNFNTVARAYRMLDEAGLISTQQGRGTYILERPDDDQTEKLKRKTLEVQVTRFILTLKKQGYDPDEIEARLDEVLNLWRLGRPTEDNLEEE